jgi:hypothetical protein
VLAALLTPDIPYIQHEFFIEGQLPKLDVAGV